MGNCFSKQQDDLNESLLGGNDGRSDVKPDQPVRSPDTQAELDKRQRERIEQKELNKEQRRLASLDRKSKEEEKKAILAEEREQSAAAVAADTAKRAATSAQRKSDLEKRNGERAANKQAPKSAE